MNQRLLQSILMLLIPFCSFASSTENFEWQTEENINGIELATAVDALGLHWVKVSTVVEGRYWSLLNLLRDTPNATKWVDNAKVITLIQRPDYLTDVVYTVMHAPWPFANRQMTTVSALNFDISKQILQIDIQQSHDYEDNEDYVTMESIKGTWSSEQITTEQIRITWTGTGLAGGSIPDWLAISQLQSSTLKTFENLRDTISQTKYQAKPLAYQIFAEKVLSPPEQR